MNPYISAPKNPLYFSLLSFYGIHVIFPPSQSPVNHLINDTVLLAAAAPQVYPGGLDAFMPQKVGKQGDVAAFLNKILGKPVPEAMGIHDLRVQMVAGRKHLELGPYA